MKILVLAIVAFGFVAPASASTCFWKRSASSFSVPKDSEGVVHIRAGREYKVSVSFCRQHELDGAHRIAFKTWPRNSSRVCRGDQLVLVELSGWETICNITKIERIKKEKK